MITVRTIEQMLTEISPYTSIFDRNIFPNEDIQHKEMFGLFSSRNNHKYDLAVQLLKLAGISYEDDRDYSLLAQLLNSIIIEDSFKVAHDSNPTLPIRVTLYTGEKGRIFRVENRGNGFNYDERIDLVEEICCKRGQDFFFKEYEDKPHMTSIYYLHHNRVEGSYEKGGRAINLLLRTPSITI